MRFTVTLVAALAATTFIGAGCGSDEDNDEPAAQRGETQAAKAPKLAPAAVIEDDPYAISCGHVRDQQKWGRVTRQATVAIANQEQFRGQTLLQTTQSLFFAMTELCKGQAASYRVAKPAVRGVQQGKFKADLGAP
jgi:hypothetical protein